MLVNMADVPEYFVSALIVTGVLLVGKVFATIVGTFLTGHDGETALKVGTTMPQPGEFSLAIAKSGTEHAAVGAQGRSAGLTFKDMVLRGNRTR